jgi:hypothetical protein
MRLRMQMCQILLLSSLAAAPALHARLLQYFSLEGAWQASSVVVVRETSRAARFEVVNSWKGNLARGSIIDVPAMAPLQSQPDLRLPDQKAPGPQDLSLVLFLREQSPVDANHPQWVPATSDMKLSFVWLQNSRAYCFLPDFELTDLKLQDCGISSATMWLNLRTIIYEQAQFEAARQIPDKAARAEGLAPFVASQYRAARSAAFEELQNCGPDGVPTVVAILNDPALLDRHDAAIKILVAMEGQQAGPEITALLDSDIRFWTAIGPTLKTGWSYSTPDNYLLQHNMRTMCLIRALADIRFSAARKDVTALRDAWQSLPAPVSEDVRRQQILDLDGWLSRFPSN